MDEVRNRYLRDRVMTATPAQRVVMLYDRLALDLDQAANAVDGAAAGPHLRHATDIVAELLGSLRPEAGGPAENLADLYGYLIRTIVTIRANDERHRIAGLANIVADLRTAFAGVAEAVAGTASAAAATAAARLAGTTSAGGATVSTAWVG